MEQGQETGSWKQAVGDSLRSLRNPGSSFPGVLNSFPSLYPFSSSALLFTSQQLGLYKELPPRSQTPCSAANLTRTASGLSSQQC